MNARKKELEKLCGPPKPKPRSIWINWSYKAELFAFGKRLNEDLSENSLQKVFIHKSYVQSEETKRQELGVELTDLELNLEDNSAFIAKGHALMTTFIEEYLDIAYPNLPGEGKRAVQEFLLDDNQLAHLASNLGFKDLILSTDFPPEIKTLATTFKALVGAIKEDGSVPRAEQFVHDFIVPQLVGKDILEIWDIPNPVGYFKNLIRKSGKEPETRLLRETGRNTIFAVYLVGIYVEKELVGQGAGETLEVAEEMACLAGLKRGFLLKEEAPPLLFGPQHHQMKQLANTRKTVSS